MNIPFNAQDNNEPVTIYQYCKYPQGTREREVLELYMISKSGDLVSFELATREKIPCEKN